MTQTLLFILAMTAIFHVHSLPCEKSEHLQQKRETSNAAMETSNATVETSRLIIRLDNLTTAMKEVLAHTLDVAADSLLLEPPSESSVLRIALHNMCTMKRLLTALDAAEASQFAADGVESGDREDLEISALQIVVAKSYEQNCEWMVSVAGSDLSAAEAGCNSTTPFSDTAVGLCTYWDALEIVEEAKQELDNLDNQFR